MFPNRFGRENAQVGFDEPLAWQRLDAKRASQVYFLLAGGRLLDQQYWSEIQDRIINAMIRLERAFKPEIQRPKLGEHLTR